jgi:hypothetical protein
VFYAKKCLGGDEAHNVDGGCRHATSQSSRSAREYSFNVESYHNERTRGIFVSYGTYLKGSGRGQLKCDGTRAETRSRLSAKRTSPIKSAGVSVQSTTGSRGVRISGSNAGYTMFLGSVKGTGYPLHSPVSPSLPLPCVTLCHHISTGVYHK